MVRFMNYTTVKLYKENRGNIVSIFVIFITMDVRASLHVLRLIPQAIEVNS